MGETAYKEYYADMAYRLCLLGSTNKQLAEAFGVCVNTIDNWRAKHFEFQMAVYRGKTEADMQVVESLFQRATGCSHKDTKFASHEGKITDAREFMRHLPPDIQACMYWLNNRQGYRWTSKQQVDVRSGDGSMSPTDDARKEARAKLKAEFEESPNPGE